MIHFNVSPKEPQQNEQIDVLSKNIDLVLANADKILKNEPYYHIHVKGTGIDGLYVGHADLSLGDLIRLWQSNMWKDGKKYYYHLGGSPLSGFSFCTYFSNKKIGCDKNVPSFGALFKPAAMVLAKQKVTDAVQLPLPKRVASNLNINQLIADLKQMQR